MKGRCAVTVAGTVLSSIAGGAARHDERRGQFAFVLLVGLV